MNHLFELKDYFKIQTDKLKSTIEKEKNIRDTSPSAMQSHHDTTRNQTEKLIQAMEIELRELEKNIELIPNEPPLLKEEVNLWSQVVVKIGNNKLIVLLVPKGLGGNKLTNFQTLAENSPLGEVIFNKKTCDKFEINNNEGVILEIL